MIVIHTYYNIWLAARNGWKIFLNRRDAVRKLNHLSDATQEQLNDLEDVCAICFDPMSSAKITRCGHYFHASCLRKWLYIQSSCPLCHQDILVNNAEQDWQLLKNLQRLAAVGWHSCNHLQRSCASWRVRIIWHSKLQTVCCSKTISSTVVYCSHTPGELPYRVTNRSLLETLETFVLFSGLWEI